MSYRRHRRLRYRISFPLKASLGLIVFVGLAIRVLGITGRLLGRPTLEPVVIAPAKKPIDRL